MAIQNTFYLDVDIKRDNYVDEPKVTQNDAVTFVLRMTDDGVDYPLAGVSTYTLASLRPDGQSVLTVGTLTAPNEITFELGSTEVSVPGNVKAAIQLYDVDGRVSSIPFTYEVTKDIATGYIPSVEEKTLIELVLGEGPAILAAAEAATITANDAAANADTKAALANAEAQSANSAAIYATDSGLLAEQKAALADASAMNADTATYNAENATQEAQDATDAINAVLPNVEGLENKGEYNIATTYVKNNLVERNGSSWQALQDTLGNPPPTLPTKSNTYWTLVAQRGVDGMGAVSTVNGEGPDVNGNVSITIPDPDLSGLATKDEFDVIVAKGDSEWINVLHPPAPLTAVVGDQLADDTLALQDIINYCLSFDNPKTMMIPSMCKITSSLVIDRLVDTNTNEFRIVGLGSGGIYVDSAINIFDSTFNVTTDPLSELVTFEGVRFESSINTLNAYVITEKFLRIKFLNCSFQKIKCLASTIYTQSWYFDNRCDARGWNGYFFASAGSFDIKVIGFMFEHGGKGIRSIGALQGTSGMVITHTVFEGCVGPFIEAGGLSGCSIIGNYCEVNQNLNYSFNGGLLNKSITFSGNLSYVSASNKSNASFYDVVVGNTVSFNGGGNYCDGRMYDFTGSSYVGHIVGDTADIELYKGAKTGLKDANRNPTGVVFGKDGKKVFLANGPGFVGFDTDTLSFLIGGYSGENSDVIDGELIPIRILAGSQNPQANPGWYGNIKWSKGSRISNSLPSIGQPKGWICTVSGSPGTWVSEGNL